MLGWWRLATVTAGVGLAPLMGTGVGWAQEPPARISASMREGRVTLSARDASLREVLVEFGRASGIAVRVDASAGSDETTIAFDRMPPEDGLRRLLRAKNYILVYAGTSLAEVRAYGRGPAPQGPEKPSVREPSPSTGAAGPEALRLRAKSLSDPDPSERIVGLRELVAGEDEPFVLETAARVLETERDADVLQNALATLSAMPRMPLEPILAFVNANRVRDPGVRIQALELMADRGPADSRVKEILVALASRDGDRAVRESASNLLQTLTHD